jgi:acyl-CoA synthetase (AMP-forming)/AMP-acid ligase II
MWLTDTPRTATTIPRMVLATCADRPTRTAVVDGTREASYDELRQEVTRLANALLALGVRRGDSVALWLPNYLEWVVCDLAIMAVGGVCVPVNTRLKADEIAYQLDQSQATVLITTTGFKTNDFTGILHGFGLHTAPGSVHPQQRADALPALRHVISVRATVPWALSYDELIAAASPEIGAELADRLAAGRSTDPATLFWTSGSTGKPKAAETTHVVLENVAVYCEMLGYTGDDACLVSTPLFYTTANYWAMVSALMCGGTVVLTQSFDAAEVWQAVSRYGVTVMVGIPNAYIGFLAHESFRPEYLATVRLIWLGGATIPPELMMRLLTLPGEPGDEPRRAVVQVYGMTETGGITTMTTLHDSPTDAANSIGFALPNFELRLVSPDTGRDVPDGAPGELWLRGPYVLPRYRNITEEQRATAFHEDWFRTGDLIRRGQDGRYSFAGRTKDIIKVSGENVSAREVELVLYDHPAVGEVAVVGVPDPVRHEAVIAFVQASAEVTAAELIEFCRTRVARFKVPREIVFIEDLPKTPTGKIQKPVLRESYLATQPADAASPR